MLRLDEAQALLKHSAVKHWISAQCPFGAPSKKLTSWVGTAVDLDDIPSHCTHGQRIWYEAGTGKAHSSPHPPSRGTRRFFPTLAEAVAHKSDSSFNSARLAAYPPLLNRYLAAKLHLAIVKPKAKPRSPVCPQVPTHQWQHRLGKEVVQVRQHLRGTPQEMDKDKRERQALGGLRNAKQSVSRLHCVATLGTQPKLANTHQSISRYLTLYASFPF